MSKKILYDYLVEVLEDFDDFFAPESLHLMMTATKALLEHFSETTLVPLCDYQLVGLVALYLTICVFGAMVPGLDQVLYYLPTEKPHQQYQHSLKWLRQMLHHSFVDCMICHFDPCSEDSMRGGSSCSDPTNNLSTETDDRFNISLNQTPILKNSNLLASGGFGSVYIASSDPEAVVKLITGEHFWSGLREVICLNLLQEASVPTVVGLGLCHLEEPGLYPNLSYPHFSTYIYMEKASGDLHRWAVRQHRCELAKLVLVDLVPVLDLAGKLGILHRDLSMANVLVFRNPLRFKLCDWGCSYISKASLRTAASVSTTQSHKPTCQVDSNWTFGTVAFRAPETLTAAPLYSTQSDVWSLGMVVLSFVCDQPIMYHENHTEKERLTCLRGPPTSPHPYLSFLDNADEQLKTVLAGMLPFDASDRKTTPQLLEQIAPWHTISRQMSLSTKNIHMHH